MTTPTHADLAARLAAEIENFQTVDTRIARLSLVDVLVITRQVFPEAAFIAVEETDQDSSGALVAADEDVLDAEENILYTNDPNDELNWVDAVRGPLANLDSGTQGIWQPFIVESETESGRNHRLDLNAIEQAIPALLAYLDGGPTYRVRSVSRTPPTHKRMAHYVPLDGDEGTVTSDLDAIQHMLTSDPGGYVLVSLVPTHLEES